MGTIRIKGNYQRIHVKDKSAYISRAYRYTTIPEDELTESAARHSLMPKGQIIAAMEAIADAFSTFLMNGHAVELPGLGTFRFSIRAHIADTKEAAGASQVYARSIRFTPTKELKRLIQEVKLKTNPIVKVKPTEGE